MKINFWRSLALAAVAGVALLGTSSQAIAISSDTTGSEAYGDSTGTFRVIDTKCDGDPAYGRFIEQGNSGIQRVNNKSGCGSTVSGDLGNAITSVQACRDTTLAKDNCGGWNEW
jgi:hypothetical protein